MDFGSLLKLQPLFSKLDMETLDLLTRFMQKALSTGDPNGYVKSVLKGALGEAKSDDPEFVQAIVEDS